MILLDVQTRFSPKLHNSILSSGFQSTVSYLKRSFQIKNQQLFSLHPNLDRSKMPKALNNFRLRFSNSYFFTTTSLNSLMTASFESFLLEEEYSLEKNGFLSFRLNLDGAEAGKSYNKFDISRYSITYSLKTNGLTSSIKISINIFQIMVDDDN